MLLWKCRGTGRGRVPGACGPGYWSVWPFSGFTYQPRSGFLFSCTGTWRPEDDERSLAAALLTEPVDLLLADDRHCESVRLLGNRKRSTISRQLDRTANILGGILGIVIARRFVDRLADVLRTPCKRRTAARGGRRRRHRVEDGRAGPRLAVPRRSWPSSWPRRPGPPARYCVSLTTARTTFGATSCRLPTAPTPAA